MIITSLPLLEALLLLASLIIDVLPSLKGYLVVLVCKAKPLVERNGTVAVLVDRLELVRRASLILNTMMMSTMITMTTTRIEKKMSKMWNCYWALPATSRSQTSWEGQLQHWSSHQTHPRTPDKMLKKNSIDYTTKLILRNLTIIHCNTCFIIHPIQTRLSVLGG